MVTDEEKQITLETILQSREFRNANTSKKLLAYLITCSVKNEHPKESSIAFDVFDKGSDFDSDKDGHIRSAIYKLRKKLDIYYKNEGALDTVKIDCPKGGFRVNFIRDLKPALLHSLISPKITIIIMSVLILTLSSLLIIILLESDHSALDNYNEIRSSFFWKDILSSEKPCTIVLGDVFTFTEYKEDLKTWRLSSDPSIIDLNSFNRYLNDHPNSKLALSAFGTLPPSVIPSLFQLIPLFYEGNKTLKYKNSSLISWRDFENSDVIYLGGVSGLYILKDITSKMRIKMRSIDQIFVTDESGIVHSEYKIHFPVNESENYRESYAVVAKIKGPFSNPIYLFVGQDYNSQYLPVEKVFNIKALKETEAYLLDEYGRVPVYFEILYKVNGYSRIGMDIELIFANNLEPAFQ